MYKLNLVKVLENCDVSNEKSLFFVENTLGLINHSFYKNSDKLRFRKIFFEQSRLKEFINKAVSFKIKINSIEFEPELDSDLKDELFLILDSNLSEKLRIFLDERIDEERDIIMIQFFKLGWKAPLKFYYNSLIIVETHDSINHLKHNFNLLRYLVGYDYKESGDSNER